MNTEYRYQLESKKLTGHQPRKLDCPHCGKRKCFVRYVDTKNGNQYVADTVGKCDHQHSCGYHYKPSEYYRDNQWARDLCVAMPSQHAKQPLLQPAPLPPFLPLDMSYVTRSHSSRSTFWQWMTGTAAPALGIGSERLQQLFDDYLIGATRRQNVIFWQVDEHQRVHGGHIMQYRADGHRDGFQGWTHIPLIRQGLLPKDWTLYQCLFGQHLLNSRPDAQVCLVESEKTALVMAALHPQYLWMATCGSGGLSPERIACLQGRRVTIFPDSGCYQKWSHVMQQTTGILYNVSRGLEQYPPNTDLCDLLL